MEEWVVFLVMGSVLPGYMFWYQYCLVGGLEAIVFGSIRWCVWSFRPSSPLRLPHLNFLFVCLLSGWISNYTDGASYIPACILIVEISSFCCPLRLPHLKFLFVLFDNNNNNNKHLRCGNRKGPLGRTDQTHQTHHRMDPTQWLPDHQLKQY